jgi:alpha-galactosidase
MGFSTWNFFLCPNINEANVMLVANSLLQVWPSNWEGKQISLKDVGYQFINLDDCWQGVRAADGTPQWNTTEFPHGFPWLVDTIHSLGLKIGIYSDAGTATCCVNFGTWGYDSIDAFTYRKWGFDYLKFDWCNIPSAQNTQYGCDSLYSLMEHWLVNADSLAYLADTTPNKVHHPLVFSMCQWNDFGGWRDVGGTGVNVWTWADSCANLWRTTDDNVAQWQSITAPNGPNDGVYNNWHSNLAAAAYSAPGGWNDPDMLEIGNGNLTATQNQSHMDLWCISSAPLLMGNNPATMSETTFTILSNREVIAVDQDSLGYQGRVVRASAIGNALTDSIFVVVKKLKVRATDTVNNKKYAVVILNNGSTAVAGDILWSDIGETNTKAAYKVRNLWLHRWLKSNNIIDTATPPDTTTTITDSLYVASIPSDGTVHVLMEMGDPDGLSSVRPQDNAALAPQLGSSMRVRGNEIFIPLAHSIVQVFDMQGRQIASISASQPGWYSVSGRGVVSGTCLVRLTTLAGSLSRVMTFVQ